MDGPLVSRYLTLALSDQFEERLRSEPLGLARPPSVRIRIEHWELNIGQIPIGHSGKLFLRMPLGLRG